MSRSEIFIHPRFNSDNFVNYDLGLAKLKKPSTKKPAPLCAADGSDNAPGTMGTILGWGTSKHSVFSRNLETVDVEIIADTECNEKYGTSVANDSVLCAGTGNGKVACTGDSGGPLLANDAVVGIVISGGVPKCGAAPGLYARVANLLHYNNDIVDGGSSGNVTGKL
ncbi:unnamed protein product [Phytophthora lilii]|uniref:Unnamed protein product n=1 Tax=Phytophthora lilii TaxID=2077276 RepID=A0A9W6U6T6_9STRA|nr:unnamed protein product [Phytophthora lilii]